MLQDSIFFMKKNAELLDLKSLTVMGIGMGKKIKIFSVCISNYNSSLSKTY